MAVSILARIVVYLVARGTPIIVRTVSSPQPTQIAIIGYAIQQYWDDIVDPNKAIEEIEAKLNSTLTADELEGGMFFAVTDFTGTFELRKLQWRISRAPAGGTSEDVAVMTFHFLKTSGGTPAAWVDGTDLPAVETALGTYWGTLKSQYSSSYHSDQYRWYKDGPAYYVLNGAGTAYVPIGDNPAIRVQEVDVPGTSGASAFLPPQDAFTITEITSSRRHWGRWYLPAMSTGNIDGNGRVPSGQVTSLLGQAVTFYNACRAASVTPVVWAIQKPERPKKPSGTLPPFPATAYEVTSLQMDDLVDVIRSRRWDAPTLRNRTTLT